MQQFYISMISLGWMVWMHPFYISLTEIRQNPDSQRLEIAQKIFWDDLEVGLREYYDEKIDFLNPRDSEKLTQQITDYLLSHFEIKLDEKEISLTLLGYEIEEDAAWFYLESKPAEWKSKIQVTNRILTNEFSSQQNIIHIYKDSRSPRSLLLGRGKEKDSLSFSK